MLNVDLINILMEQVGVNEGQAKGGLGLILKLLEGQLEGTQFEQIVDLIPLATEVMGAAPELGGGSGGIMGLLMKLLPFLGGGGSLGALAQVAGGFSQLGMEPSQASDFVPIIGDFLKQQGGEEIGGLLSSVLG